MGNKIEQKKAREIFFELLRIRSIEEEISRLYPEQEMRCPVHLSIGQEAASVGLCAQLMEEDYMVSSHRSHAHYLAKGGSLNALIGELYGKVTGCSRGQGGSMHLIDLSKNFIGATSIVGGTIPIGVGAAFSAKLKGEKRISVICIGDSAIEEGVFHESFNFAALHKLPVLFMCENNNYSCYTPIENRQPKRPVIDVAKAHGAFSKTIDGNDVFKVFENIQGVIETVRNGDGPAFLEFLTFRHLEHCGPYNDDHLGFRPANEIKEGRNNDVVANGLKFLKDNGFYDSDWEVKIKEKISLEVKAAFTDAKSANFPGREELGAYIYAN